VYDEHKTDRTDIILSIDSTDPLFKVKNLLLTKKLLQSSQIFTLPLHRGENWKIFQIWLRIAALNKEEAGQLLKDPNMGFISNRNELAALNFLHEGLKNTMSQYSTTLQEDIKYLSSKEKELTSHEKLMIRYRKSEKALLWEASEWLQKKVEELEKIQKE